MVSAPGFIHWYAIHWSALGDGDSDADGDGVTTGDGENDGDDAGSEDDTADGGGEPAMGVLAMGMHPVTTVIKARANKSAAA